MRACDVCPGGERVEPVRLSLRSGANKRVTLTDVDLCAECQAAVGGGGMAALFDRRRERTPSAG